MKVQGGLRPSEVPGATPFLLTFRNFVHPIDCRVLPYSPFTGLGANLKKLKEKPDEVQKALRNTAALGRGEVEGWVNLML